MLFGPNIPQTREQGFRFPREGALGIVGDREAKLLAGVAEVGDPQRKETEVEADRLRMGKSLRQRPKA